MTATADPPMRSMDEYSNPSMAYQLLLRLRIENNPGNLGRVTTAIGAAGADIGAIDIAEAASDHVVRDIRVGCRDEAHAHEVIAAVGGLPGITVEHASDRTFQLHRNGKIRVENKVNIRTMAELAHVYTPGVGRVSMAIHDNPDAVWSLTTKVNTVAIVTDGTAVLGLGDIGPEAALPVMEGKAMLFKSFGEIDAWPICLDTKDTEEIIRITQAIAPGFGGILLEDISAPRCFEIEDRLRELLDIPVFHDDQHGTAVVVLAAFINALKVVGKRPETIKMVLTGVGASGVAVSKILMNYGVKNIIGFDRTGAVYKGRTEGMNFMKEWFADHTNPEGFDGTLTDAMKGADFFVGLSGPRTITPDQVRSMADGAIVFALANPEPEIRPELIQGMAQVIATGRSDYPNQVNNVLCFPGLFRGTFDAMATTISEEMKIAAATAIAGTIPDDQLSEDYILPSVFNPDVLARVRVAVHDEALRTGRPRKLGSRVFI
jgi:malate dehydrogenase (oxaloacetate-decarboxylating)